VGSKEKYREAGTLIVGSNRNIDDFCNTDFERLTFNFKACDA